MKIPFLVPATVLVCTLAQAALAGEANVRTPSPVIHLKDNLDEVDGLGWCIDTVGRGYAETLHAHSCKPQGGDVQFAHDPETGAIQSVAFSEKCIAVLPEGASTDFGLRDCDNADPAQQFSFDPATGAIAPGGVPSLCMAVGESSRRAGPFMSRDLVLDACAAIEPALRTWVIRDCFTF
ncbi:MAG: RICIN domain-containing protein [Boseongicola sp.]|nr:RICIN domain-containing protein [Boseongicola sp.]